METLFKNFYADKQILITGGAGFIGSHLAEKLVTLGAKVTILDNFATGFMSNLRPILPYISIQYADITSPFSTQQATIKKDIVFHCAAFVSVPQSTKYPDHCFLVNESGTNYTLSAAIKNGVKKFVFSSSAAVYGNKESICSESDTPNPESPYAISKLKGEILCKKASLDFGISTTSLRYFNVYGERQNPEGDYAAVVAKFTECLKLKKPITIFGSGEQTRDFIAVSKVVNANLAAGMHYEHKGEILNVASGKSINLKELIEQLESELKISAVQVVYQNSRPGDIKNSTADNTKLKNLLDTEIVLSSPQQQEQLMNMLP